MIILETVEVRVVSGGPEREDQARYKQRFFSAGKEEVS